MAGRKPTKLIPGRLVRFTTPYSVLNFGTLVKRLSGGNWYIVDTANGFTLDENYSKQVTCYVVDETNITGILA